MSTTSEKMHIWPFPQLFTRDPLRVLRSSNCRVGVVRTLQVIGFSCCQKKRRGRTGQISFLRGKWSVCKDELFLQGKWSVCTNFFFCRENGLLKETKSELEHAIAETERPLRYWNEFTKSTFFLPGASIVLEFNFSLLPGSIMNVSRTERLGSASTWSRTRWRTVSRGRWRTSRPTSRGCRRCLQR